MVSLKSLLCKVKLCFAIFHFLFAFCLFPAILKGQQTLTEQPKILELGEHTTINTNELTIITGEDVTTEKILGARGGFFHPYLSVREEWTDNLFNINIDQVDNFLTTLSTGIWYSLPRLDNVPVSFSTHNAAIGGTRLSLTEKKSFNRSLAYVFGGLDYNIYSSYSELDNTAWRVEGLYQQNLPAGISIRLIDRLSKGQDSFDIGSFLPRDFTVDGNNTTVSSLPSRIRSYHSNLAHLNVMFDLTGKFSTQLECTSFYLNYDNEENSWLNRTDTRYSATIEYNYSPKTSFFIEYNFASLTYDTQDINDGTSSFYYAGINWNGSGKTSLFAKGGYQNKKYNDVLLETVGSFTAEVHLNYMITDKTKISANLYKALEETSSLLNNGVDTVAAGIHYEQRFNSRVRGQIDFSYEKNDYQGFTRAVINDTVDDREDISFSVRPAVEYAFRDWMMCDLAYIYESRNSNMNIYDFTTQTVMLSLNIAF